MPRVDLYGLGTIQDTSSLSFLFDSTWMDLDRGLGCSEAYEANSSTMKWVKAGLKRHQKARKGPNTG